MALLAQHKRQFLAAVGDCQALFRHCLAPQGTHTHAGVEAAFLQLFKSWESFLEECTLSFLCGRLRCDGTSIPTHTVSQNEEWARKSLYQDRRFVEWTQTDRIARRWSALFITPSALDTALRPGTVELGQMNTLRNAIAHSSYSSQRSFIELVQSQFGGRKRFSRPALLLSELWPQDPALTFFDRYAAVLQALAPRVAG